MREDGLVFAWSCSICQFVQDVNALWTLWILFWTEFSYINVKKIILNISLPYFLFWPCYYKRNVDKTNAMQNWINKLSTYQKHVKFDK